MCGGGHVCFPERPHVETGGCVFEPRDRSPLAGLSMGAALLRFRVSRHPPEPTKTPGFTGTRQDA